MNMKRHILDVHVNKNIKPFKCTMCSFASHAKRYLLWHVRRHHNPNNPPGGDPKGTVMESFTLQGRRSALVSQSKGPWFDSRKFIKIYILNDFS